MFFENSRDAFIRAPNLQDDTINRDILESTSRQDVHMMETEICVMDSGLVGYETDGTGKGRLADSDGNVEQKKKK